MAGSVSTLLVRPLVLAVNRRASEFFGATDLTPQVVADDDARISPAQFCVAWAEAMRLTGDPQLGLTIAAATPPGAFGIVEYVCRSAATLGDALRQWVRYLNLLDDAVEVALVTEGDQLASASRVVQSPASQSKLHDDVALHATLQAPPSHAKSQLAPLAHASAQWPPSHCA